MLHEKHQWPGPADAQKIIRQAVSLAAKRALPAASSLRC